MFQGPNNTSRVNSPLALCLAELSHDGRAVVSLDHSAIDDADALPILEALHVSTRDEIAIDVPKFSPAVALWAARLFYQLCRFVVCRDIGQVEIKEVCEVRCPVERGPESDWSADLTLRHLPRVFQLARHLGNGDPLVEEIKKIATAWPLSSVGITGLEQPSLDSFVHHPALCRLYADRILAAEDVSRLGDPRIDDLLRSDIGIYHDLSPSLANKLFEPAHDPN